MIGRIRNRLAIWGLCGCALLAAGPSEGQAPHRRAAKSATIWSGTSGGYRWKWTTSDLAAYRVGVDRPVFTAKAYEKHTSPLFKGDTSDPVDTYADCTIQPLSIVGSIVSYERDYYWEGGAHPSGSVDYLTIDVARPGHQVKLTDLFPDTDVLKALLEDKIVQDTLKRNHTAGTPRTTAQLVELLKGKTFGSEDNSNFAFEDDLLERFAFHHVQGNQVAVRLNISWGAEVFRFTTTQIGILLPISPRMARVFAQASARREGFLMSAAKKLAAGRPTLLFTFGKAPN